MSRFDHPPCVSDSELLRIGLDPAVFRDLSFPMQWLEWERAREDAREEETESAAMELAAALRETEPLRNREEKKEGTAGMESWQMTLAEWKQRCVELRERGDEEGLRAIGGFTTDFAHRFRVEQALKAGKFLPSRVLDDYPELREEAYSTGRSRPPA